MPYLKLSPSWWRFFIVALLVLGVFFRFFNLGGKVYWHDEVYTSIRAAGFTRQEIDRELFQNKIIPAQELQKYQRLKPGSTLVDTIKSLEIEDPQHSPLYFLMARFWMQGFGSSLTASRTLPALLSLLALPLMYGLGLELFNSPIVALVATTLLALSPFDILFAQTARQYSLLTATVIGSSFLLLRALRLPSWRNWRLYTLVNTLGWYTHPFFGLTVIAQGIYVILLAIASKRQEAGSAKAGRLVANLATRTALGTFLAIAVSLILYSPWLVVLKTSYQRFYNTTKWTEETVDFIFLLKLWILNFTSLFLDLDFGFASIWTYLLRLSVLLAIATAIYTVCHKTNRTSWLFILISIFVPFLILALPDLLLGGKRSSVSRYLISCYPGVQLAVAYLLATKILHKQRFWRGVTLLLIIGSIASCTVSAFSDTWWNKDLSYSNAEIIRRLNTTSSPLIISNIGDDFTNTGNLISLSYSLHNNVQLLLLSEPPNLEVLNLDNSELFLFRPGTTLVQAIKSKPGKLVPIISSGELLQWRKM